jgi:hypothetical protein
MFRLGRATISFAALIPVWAACGGSATSPEIDGGHGGDASSTQDGSQADAVSSADSGHDAAKQDDAGSGDASEDGCAILKAADADVQCGKPCDLPGVSCSPGGPGDPVGWSCESGSDGGSAIWFCSPG